MLTVRSSAGGFNDIEQRAIKQGLSTILGVSSAVSVIINFNLDGLSDDPYSIDKTLHSVFGSPAAEILEREIAKEIYSQLGIPPPVSNNFFASVDAAKQIFKETSHSNVS